MLCLSTAVLVRDVVCMARTAPSSASERLQARSCCTDAISRKRSVGPPRATEDETAEGA